jgi:hypothetical protein
VKWICCRNLGSACGLDLRCGIAHNMHMPLLENRSLQAMLTDGMESMLPRGVVLHPWPNRLLPAFVSLKHASAGSWSVVLSSLRSSLCSILLPHLGTNALRLLSCRLDVTVTEFFSFYPCLSCPSSVQGLLLAS